MAKEREERKRLDQELNGLSLVSRDSDLFLKLLSISFHYEDNWKSDLNASQPSRNCYLSAIVPFCEGGTLCERLFKGLSLCAGDHMLSVAALLVTDMAQKYHLAREIADALCHCHALGIVHSDLCCCNILLTRKEPPSAEVSWGVKVANTGVFPDSDSFEKRRVYLAPELLTALTPHSDKGAQSTCLHSPTSPHTPPLHSRGHSGLSLQTSMFSKESDVYALGITLLQLFRHTLTDCKERICAMAAQYSSDGLNVPLFPKDTQFIAAPPIPSLHLQRVISLCTRRDPKTRPSAAEIRFAFFTRTFRFHFILIQLISATCLRVTTMTQSRHLLTGCYFSRRTQRLFPIIYIHDQLNCHTSQ
jgi:serine/threonine protein kinase